jgi:hypothetical protein
MNLTTRINRRPVRTVAFAVGTAVLLAASACGTEQAIEKAPTSIKKAVPSADAGVPADVEECLVHQAKVDGAILRCWQEAQPEEDEPQLLAPNGRPVPVPGGNG